MRDSLPDNESSTKQHSAQRRGKEDLILMMSLESIDPAVPEPTPGPFRHNQIFVFSSFFA